MNLNELYESNIFDLVESQYRILSNTKQEETQQEQSNVIDNFDAL